MKIELKIEQFEKEKLSSELEEEKNKNKTLSEENAKLLKQVEELKLAMQQKK